MLSNLALGPTSTGNTMHHILELTNNPSIYNKYRFSGAWEGILLSGITPLGRSRKHPHRSFPQWFAEDQWDRTEAVVDRQRGDSQKMDPGKGSSNCEWDAEKGNKIPDDPRCMDVIIL